MGQPVVFEEPQVPERVVDLDVPVVTLSDEEVLSLCNLMMSEEQSDELSDLLADQREGQLTAAGRERLDELMNLYDQYLLRKAEGLAVAVRRGLMPPLNERR